MRAGISRVVVEIIILVIAVALALLIFSPISGYIFGSLGRTATVGGTTQIQVLNARFDGTYWYMDVKNLGPGTPTLSSTPVNDFKVYMDGQSGTINDVLNGTVSATGGASWKVGTVLTIKASSLSTDTTKQHNIVIYGPGGTQAQYLYYPSSS